MAASAASLSALVGFSAFFLAASSRSRNRSRAVRESRWVTLRRVGVASPFAGAVVPLRLPPPVPGRPAPSSGRRHPASRNRSTLRSGQARETAITASGSMRGHSLRSSSVSVLPEARTMARTAAALRLARPRSRSVVQGTETERVAGLAAVDAEEAVSLPPAPCNQGEGMFRSARISVTRRPLTSGM